MFTKLGNCKTKAVALSLIPAYADQFVVESRAVPVVSDLFNTENLDMNFPELLKLCLNVNLDISDEQTEQVEKDTRSQAKGSGYPFVVLSLCQSQLNVFSEIAVCQPV